MRHDLVLLYARRRVSWAQEQLAAGSWQLTD
jgi:hypothetical protein